MLLDPLRSLTDIAFYAQVSRASLRRVSLYLAYLGLLFSAFSTAVLYDRLLPDIEETVAWAAAAVPPMTLSKGRLTSALKSPLRLEHPGSERLALMIDTGRSSTPTLAEMNEKKVVLMLTGAAAYVAGPEGLRTYAFSDSGAESLSIDAAFFRRTGTWLRRVLFPAAFAATWAAFILWKHVSAAAYAGLGLLLAAGLPARPGLPELYRMAAYAQTSVVALQAAALLWPDPIPYFEPLSLIVVGTYLWQAARQAPARAEP